MRKTVCIRLASALLAMLLCFAAPSAFAIEPDAGDVVGNPDASGAVEETTDTGTGGASTSAIAGTPQTNGAITKEEVVYANLSNTGDVEKAYVVNIFNLSEDGEITDYGDYVSVLNLTNTEPIARDGMKTTVRAEAGRFYYQGNLSAKLLPWKFSLRYMLDGADIEPEALAGQNGALTLQLTSEKCAVIDSTFADNYMLQISVTLDARKCKNIVAEGGTPANAGNNRMYTFTVMPGSDANITLTADVTDFTMTGVTINAVPFSLSIGTDIVDTESFTGELTQLQDAIGQVNEGASALTEGIEQLKNGCKKLRNGSSQFRDGLNELSANSGELRTGSSQIADAAQTLNGVLDEIRNALRSLEGNGDLSSLPGILRSSASALESEAGSFRSAQSSLEQLHSRIDSLTTVDTSGVKATPEYASSAEIQSFVSDVEQQNDSIRSVRSNADATIPALSATLGDVCDSMEEAAARLRSAADLIESGGSGDSTGDALSQLKELDAGISQLLNGIVSLDDGIRQYTNAVDTLADNYPSIHKGISGVSGGLTDLFGGAEQFVDGTGQLAAETSGMDSMVEEKIDEVFSDFDKSDYVPASFVSIQNRNVTEVQFVIKAEGISPPEAAPETPVPEEATTFLTRLVDLLEKYGIVD